MAKLLQFLISLIPLFNQSPIVEDYSSSIRAYAPFDYFTLSLTWPQSYCMTIACKYKRPLPSDFTIHGLWPNDFNKELINCYTDEKYKEITQGELFKSLTKRMPYLEQGESYNSKFWGLEWTKHGTCSLSKYNQKQYFNLAVNLAKKYDVLAALKKKNITPGPNPYQAGKIREAVRGLNGNKKPSLVCQTRSKQLLLVEVRICFDPNGDVIDCPTASPTCGAHDNNVYFPKA